MATEKQFGNFFRASRKALGVNLREFCRRNGFDPGNLSRLERGLASPPSAPEGLDVYAAALKLARGTELWSRFYELAAAETGRIPPELMADEAAIGRLPHLFRQLRSGPGHRNWVTARHLEDWAGMIDARSILPQLIRRLVAATGRGVSKYEFPALEQTQRPGVDGVVEASENDAFVPSGVSVWEMGVEKDPKGKAEKDFEKRRRERLGVEKRKATYVFVTPRKWQGKGEWVKAKAKLKVWREVRVYDSASLEEWLERAAGVDVWLGRLLGLRPDNLVDIDEYWQNLRALTDPSLAHDVFLASRGGEAKELKEWLKGPPGALAIVTRSPSEAIDFVIAAHSDPLERDSFAARAVIVEDRNAWRSIVMADGSLTLLPHPDLPVEPEMVAEAVRRGHRVILSAGGDRTGETPVIEIPRAYRYDLKDALVRSGMDAVRAEETSRKSGGSLTVLKRILARFPGTTRPEWSRQPDALELVPLLLAGSWEDTSDGDRLAMEDLAGRSFEQISAIAERWAGRPDPPLQRVLSRWSLVSRDDSWFLLAPEVGTESLKRFEQVALKVLGHEDPSYELPPEKRWQAALYRKVSPYSYALRTGLAESLALLGGRSGQLKVVSKASEISARIVRQLLHNADWKRWASLSPQLPLLAEAAPEDFLEITSEDLGKSHSTLVGLFEQEGDPLFTSSPHTGLLWALEGLAWDRQNFSSVCLTLAGLEERAPAGKLGNRPGRSLAEILMPWFPQTTAPVEERVRVMQRLAKKCPEAAWRLLLALLPQMHQFAHTIHRPSWRDWALSWREGATNFEYWRQTTVAGELLVNMAGNDVERWKGLIDAFENLPEPSRATFYEKLEALAEEKLSDSGRRAISEALREKIGHHRRFPEAAWTLPEDTLRRFEDEIRRLEPEDPIERHGWLFGPSWKVGELVQNAELSVEEFRRCALSSTLTAKKWQGILELVQTVESPSDVGDTLARMEGQKVDKKILPSLLASEDPKLAQFVYGYSLRRFADHGWSWIEGLNSKRWAPGAVARLASFLPFVRKTWDYVSSRGSEVEGRYWSFGRSYIFLQDPGELQYATSKLIENGRALIACHLLSLSLTGDVAREPGRLLESLEAALQGLDAEGGAPALAHAQHDLQTIFRALQSPESAGEPGYDEERLARLEWQYLALLDGHSGIPRTLHGLLSRDPVLFVDLLAAIFRRDDEPRDENRILTNEEKARAHNAYSLIKSWKSVPGRKDDGLIDENELFTWVEKARQIARERGYLGISDSKIGEVLAWDRQVDNEPWPSIPVRDVLEDVGTEELFDGWEVGISNRRGMVSRSPREGGEQERALAKRYFDYADACKIDWPKVASSLRRVAKQYEREGEVRP